MTYRELLQLYKTGQLDEQTRREVEEAIEKQDAISDYLFEASEIPLLEEAVSAEGPEQSADRESDRFVALVQRSIRRAFIKTGVIVGAVVLAVVLCSIFVLPKAVDMFFYNPNEVVGVDPEAEYLTTERMQLDLAVYSELYLPGAYRDSLYAEPEGYGTYSIRIPQTFTFGGRRNTISGKLTRNKLTLYDTNPLTPPVGNAFVMPAPIPNNNIVVIDGVEQEDYGPGGSREDAIAATENLVDGENYLGFVSLSQIMDYDSFADWLLNSEAGYNELWCAVAARDEWDHLIRENIGFRASASGYHMDWDKKSYPYLSLLNNDDLTCPEDFDGDIMKQHFLSMLQYQKDHPEFAEMMGRGADPYGIEKLIEVTEANPLETYGFAIVAEKETFLDLWEDPMVKYIYTTPIY